MQQTDVTQYPNSSGWRVVQDAETNLYKIVNQRGRVLQGVYTSRNFANRDLATYLARVDKNHPSKAKKKD